MHTRERELLFSRRVASRLALRVLISQHIEAVAVRSSRVTSHLLISLSVPLWSTRAMCVRVCVNRFHFLPRARNYCCVCTLLILTKCSSTS